VRCSPMNPHIVQRVSVRAEGPAHTSSRYVGGLTVSLLLQAIGMDTSRHCTDDQVSEEHDVAWRQWLVIG